MTIKHAYLLVLGFIALHSCIPYRSIDIQYYDKPKQSLPINSGKVLIIANLYNRDLSNKKVMMEWALDSVAASEAISSLGDLLVTSPLYENLTPQNAFYYRSDTSKVILPIGWDQISTLSANNDSVDVIISLDYMRVNPYSDNIPKWEGGIKSFYGYLDIAVYCYWRVYSISNRKISNSFLHRDTLSWEATDWVEVKTGKQLPGFFSAAAYAGADAAEKYAKLIAPNWNSDSRIIFNSGSKLFVEADKLAEQGDWIEAAALWQKLTKEKNSKIAAKAAFNLALANEMLGNFELAMEWLTQAKQLNPKLIEIEDYRRTIKGRIEANK